MTDGPAEQARDLDRLVAELRDLEAYNQRQERVLRRMQRSTERDAVRTHTASDHTAGGSNADEFFGRRSSSGGGGAKEEPALVAEEVEEKSEE